MANPNITVLSAPDEESDSDVGVLLFGFNKRTPRQQPQTMTDFEFTFDIPLSGKFYVVQALFLCNQSENRTPHHHQTSAKHHPTSDHGNLAFDASKCYVAPSYVIRESEVLQSCSPTSSMEDVTRLLDHTTIGGRNLSEMTSPDIQRFLRNVYRNDHRFLRECQKRDERNPFPDIDINIGWNRARYDLEEHFQHPEGGVEERLKIQEGFAQFSLARQLDSLALTEDVCAGMFECLFVGTSRDKSGWSREPGSWWGARKRLFAVGRGDLAKDAKKTVKHIMMGVVLWQSEAVNMEGEAPSRKRPHLMLAEETMAQEGSNTLLRPCKRIKPAGGKSEEVMSEAWKAKRRLQEKKAGRWTDGTLRMNRLWDHFHWVLNADDPKDNRWDNQ